MSVVFKPVHRKLLAEAADANSSVIDASVDLADKASDVPIVEDEIVRKAEHGT